MYIYHDKKENNFFPFGNLTILSEEMGLPIDTLRHKFQRKKTKLPDGKWVTDRFTIVKCNIIKRRK